MSSEPQMIESASGGMGLTKSEQPNWKDTNVALLGSEEDKAARKSAAAHEPAWKECGLKAGIEVWRIEHFHVVPVDTSTYGQFYKGDSYIVLQTIEGDNNVVTHQIYFYLGTETSIDEQGTAAYKTVELDDFFDGEPTQHREVMEEESEAFKELFGGSISYLDGGVDSGFKHVVPEGWDTKMYQVRKVKGKTEVMQVPLHTRVIDQSDVYILDAPDAIYVLEGVKASPAEKVEATMKAEQIEQNRASAVKVTHECDDNFWKLLEGPALKVGFCGADAVVKTQYPEGTYVEVTSGDHKDVGTKGIILKEAHEQGKPTRWRVQFTDGRETWADSVKPAGEKPEDFGQIEMGKTKSQTARELKVKTKEYKKPEKEEADPSLTEGTQVEILVGKAQGSKGKLLKVMNMRYRVELEDGSTTWTDKVQAI